MRAWWSMFAWVYEAPTTEEANERMAFIAVVDFLVWGGL